MLASPDLASPILPSRLEKARLPFAPMNTWHVIALALFCLGCTERSASDTDASEEDTATEPDTCASVPQPGGMPSGIEQCEPSVSWNRTEPLTCAASATVPPEDDGCINPCMSFAVPGVCRSDTGITGDPFCHYECQTDADCGEGAACICAFEGMHGFNQCVDASCRSDADCASGSCGLSRHCGLVSKLECRSDADACGGDADCSVEPGSLCTYVNRDARFECSLPLCGE